MRRLAIILLPLLLLSGSSVIASDVSDGALTINQYVAELDRVNLLVRQLPVKTQDAASFERVLRSIPSSWKVEVGQQTFEISADWLRDSLREFREKPSPEIVERISSRLSMLQWEASSSQKTGPAQLPALHAKLAGILATPEFAGVTGPTWFDQLKARLWAIVFRLLERLFTSSAIANISNILLYSLVILAFLVAAYFMYRTLRNEAIPESVLRDPLVISAKEWTVWMQEARAAANAGNWREAIHLSYWCGISFLEAQDLWPPDRARTPREYLRLLSSSNEHRTTLTDLTGIFELVWYGWKEADEATFRKTLSQLERLGCR